MTSSPGVGLANWPTLITAGDRSSAFSPIKPFIAGDKLDDPDDKRTGERIRPDDRFSLVRFLRRLTCRQPILT